MRRWMLHVALSTAVGFGAMAACSFPSPSFLTDDELGGDASGDTRAGDDARNGDAATESSASTDAGELLIDGSSPDALIVQDAGHKVDGSGCMPADCDCDKDGFNETLKAGCDTGPRDCDDNDPRVKPGQQFLTAPAEPPVFADWNCDGTATPLYDTNVSCEGLTLGLGCPNIFGFENQPSCGQTGSWIRCKPGLLSCEVGTRTTMIQPCQ